MLPAIFVYTIDPYQFFHRSYFTPMKFVKINTRMQLSGIIKNYIAEDTEFDTIAMGASLGQNFDPQILVKTLGGDKKAITLASPGASPFEQTLVTRAALDTGKLEQVMWTFGPFWAGGLEAKNEKRTFPFYMYNSNPFDDLNYAFSSANINHSIGYVFDQTGLSRFRRIYRELGIERMRVLSWREFNSWAPLTEAKMTTINAKMFSKQRVRKVAAGLKYSKKFIIDRKLDIPEYSSLPNSAYESEREILVEFLEQNPEVDFTLIVPPVSALYYYIGNRDYVVKSVYRARALAEIVERYPNAKVFGFPEQIILNDLRNYKDPAHFGRNIYRYMMHKIAIGENQISLENIADYEARLLEAINAFDLDAPLAVPSTPLVIGFNGRLISAPQAVN